MQQQQCCIHLQQMVSVTALKAALQQAQTIVTLKQTPGFLPFAAWKVSNSIRPHCSASQVGLEKQLFQTQKTNTFLVVTLLRLQPLCQDRFKQNQCPLSGSLDFRCAFLPVQATSHSSPVPREQVPWRVGRGASLDLRGVGGKWVPHVLGHGSGAWAT